MLNKLFLASAAMLLVSSAFAQTPATTTTTYSTPPTIVAGGCTITGATVFHYDPATNTITLDNATDSCNTGTTPPPPTASVSISISPTSYTLGSSAAPPVVSVTNNTPAAAVTCTLNPTNGFSVTSAGTITGTGTFALSAPTTPGTFTFTPTCTTNTSGYNTAVSVSGSTSLTVNPIPPVGGCDATQMSSSLNGITLKRQCSGQVNIMPSTITYNNALTDLGTVLGNSSFPAYKYAGYSPTFTIQSGYYVALAFKPATTGAFQLVANTSYGDGGMISLSTQPGALTRGSTGAICVQGANASNSLYVSTTSSTCQVTAGTTYYINFADTNINGDALCYNGSAGSCNTSQVSYTLYR